MLFAREVIDLMAAYPGRDWRMVHICRHIIGKTPDHRRRKAVREAVRLVLLQLESAGSIDKTPPQTNGGFALYRWKAPDEPC